MTSSSCRLKGHVHNGLRLFFNPFQVVLAFETLRVNLVDDLPNLSAAERTILLTIRMTYHKPCQAVGQNPAELMLWKGNIMSSERTANSRWNGVRV